MLLKCMRGSMGFARGFLHRPSLCFPYGGLEMLVKWMRGSALCQECLCSCRPSTPYPTGSAPAMDNPRAF
jgi:hypothetical protein